MKKYIQFLFPVLFLGCFSSGSPEAAIKKAADVYDRQMMHTPYAAPAAYFEKATCEGKYCMYTEAYGYIHYSGEYSEIKVDDFSFISENMKKSNRSDEWLKHIENIYTSGEVSYQTDFRPGYNSAFSAFRWFEEEGPFNESALYEFQQMDTLMTEEGELFSMQFKSGQVDRRRFFGTLFFEPETFILRRVVFDEISFYSVISTDWKIAEGAVYYDYEGGQGYVSRIELTYFEADFEYEIQIQSAPPTVHFNQVTSDEYWTLFRQDQNPMVEYDPDNWDSPFRFQQIDLQRISDDLSKGVPLEEQFIGHSGFPFIKEILDMQENDITTNGGEATYFKTWDILAEIKELESRNP